MDCATAHAGHRRADGRSGWCLHVCNSLAEAQPRQMIAQPPDPPLPTVFSPLLLSHLTVPFVLRRHLLRNFAHQHVCPAIFQALPWLPGIHPSPHHTSQTGQPVTPNAHLAPSSLSTLSSCHCLGEANVTGSRVAPVSTRCPLVFFRVPCMPPVIHSTCVTARL
jgi:hypothetical protein